ncbi:hypothetical protein GCM10008937_11990 [Deinococcus depolymerans]|uniref:ABC transporter permease n=1 Tax=Deinococcus depolymerans TaxID=392408 RepID=A0ABP3LSJ0_9DEIO
MHFSRRNVGLLIRREVEVAVRAGLPILLILVGLLYAVEDHLSPAGSLTAYTEVLCRRTLLLVTPFVWLYGGYRLLTFHRHGTGELETVLGVRPVTRAVAYALALLGVTTFSVLLPSLVTLFTVRSLLISVTPATALQLALNVLQLCTVVSVASSVVWLARGPVWTAALLLTALALPFVVFPAGNFLQRLPAGVALSDTFGMDRLLLVTGLLTLLTLIASGALYWAGATMRPPTRGAGPAALALAALALLVTQVPGRLYDQMTYRRMAVTAALQAPETLHAPSRVGQSTLFVSARSLPDVQALTSYLRIADLHVVEVPFLTTPTWRTADAPVLLLPERRQTANPAALARLAFTRMVPVRDERRDLAQEWACIRQFGARLDLEQEQALWKTYLSGDLQALSTLSRLGAMEDSVISSDVQRAFEVQGQEHCPAAPYLRRVH